MNDTQGARLGSQESYRLLVDSVQDYAISMLDPQGMVVTWNRGAELITGYSSEEIIGSHLSVFYAPEDIADGLPERELAAARQSGRFEDEGWRVRKGGQRYWANVCVSAMLDSNGELIGYSKLTRDLTEPLRPWPLPRATPAASSRPAWTPRWPSPVTARSPT